MANEEAREAAARLYPLPHGRARGDGTPEGAMQVAYETGYAAGVAEGIRQAREAVLARDMDYDESADMWLAVTAIDALGEDDR